MGSFRLAVMRYCREMSRLAILAYGSLIDAPGVELDDVITDRITNILTPFRVEYARSSQTRGGAPTLVPVTAGGARVGASLLVLQGDVDVADARDMLWRRETGQTDRNRQYRPPDPVTPSTVVVQEHPELGGIDLVLSTRIASNIDPLTANHLADLAIASVQTEAGARGRDGISYLINATLAGIRTPLTEPYREAILARTGIPTLYEALQSLLAYS